MNLVQRLERIEATAQTRAKLVPDNLDWLEPDMRKSAWAIERAWRLLSGPVAVRANDLSRIGHGHQEWTEAQERLARRFHAWAAYQHRQHRSINRLMGWIADSQPVPAVKEVRNLLRAAIDDWQRG